MTRYLKEMMGELVQLPNPNPVAVDPRFTAIDLGGTVSGQQGTTSTACWPRRQEFRPTGSFSTSKGLATLRPRSILLAVHDAVREGRIDRPMRIFAPGFGACAASDCGYAGRSRNCELQF